MTPYAMQPHPATPCPFIDALTVTAESLPGSLRFAYEVHGEVARLELPPRLRSLRTDGLWRHTCFEAFLREPAATAYDEFNFAPSGEWAAYHFDRYREGAAELDLAVPPRIDCHQEVDRFRMTVVVPCNRTAPEMDLGLSAVLRDQEGHIYYWALRHAPGKADFHHADAFAARVMLS